MKCKLIPVKVRHFIISWKIFVMKKWPTICNYPGTEETSFWTFGRGMSSLSSQGFYQSINCPIIHVVMPRVFNWWKVWTADRLVQHPNLYCKAIKDAEYSVALSCWKIQCLPGKRHQTCIYLSAPMCKLPVPNALMQHRLRLLNWELLTGQIVHFSLVQRMRHPWFPKINLHFDSSDHRTDLSRVYPAFHPKVLE